MIQNIDKLLVSGENSCKIKILNLSNNDLVGVDGLMNVIEKNMEWLEFLNLANNKIESIEGLFRVLKRGNDAMVRGKD